MAYGNGKSAVRLTRGVAPDGPHRFTGFEGAAITLPGDGPVILHYPYPSSKSWVAIFTLYGDFSNYWLDDPEKPNLLQFMLQSRDKVQAALEKNDWTEAREFFARRTLDDDSLKRSIASGRVRRYSPLAGQ